MRSVLFILLVFTNQFVQCQQTDERIITAFGQYLTADSNGVLTIHYDESMGWEDYKTKLLTYGVGTGEFTQLSDPNGRPLIYTDRDYWDYIRDAHSHEIIFGKQGELQRLDSVIPYGDLIYGYRDTFIYWNSVRRSQLTGDPLPPYPVQCAVGDPNSYFDLTDSGYYVGHSICSHHPDKRHGFMMFLHASRTTMSHKMGVVYSYNQIIFPWPNKDQTYGLIDLVVCPEKDPYYFIRLMQFSYDPQTKEISFRSSNQYFPFTPYCASYLPNERYPLLSGILKRKSARHFNLATHADGDRLWLSYGFMDTVYSHLIDQDGIGPVHKQIIPVRDSFEQGFAKVHPYPVWDAFTPNATKTSYTRPFYTYSRGQGRNMSCTYFVSQIGWDKPYPDDLSILCNAHLNHEDGSFSFSFMTDTIKAFCRTRAVLQPIAYSANDSILYFHKNFNYEDEPSYWQWHWQDNKRHLLGSAPNRDKLIFPFKRDYRAYDIIEPWLSPHSELLFSLGSYINDSADRSHASLSKILQKDIKKNYAFIANSNLFGNDMAIEELDNMEPHKKLRIENPEKEKEYLCKPIYDYFLNDTPFDSCQRYIDNLSSTYLPLTNYPNIWGMQYFADFRISIDTQPCFNEIIFSNASIGPHYEEFVWVLSNGDTFRTSQLNERVYVHGLKAGTYQMKLMAKDKHGRWRSKSYSFRISSFAATPVADFKTNGAVLCQWDTLKLTPHTDWLSASSQLKYKWLPNGSESFDSVYNHVNEVNVFKFPLSKPGFIKPGLILNDGTCIDTFYVQDPIKVLPAARPKFQVSDSMICLPDKILLTPLFSDPLDSAQWNIPTLGMGVSTYHQNPTSFSFDRNTSPGIYKIYRKTFISDGCERSDSAEIVINPGLPEAYAPYLHHVSFTDNPEEIELKWSTHPQAKNHLIYANGVRIAESINNHLLLNANLHHKNTVYQVISTDQCSRPYVPSNSGTLIQLEASLTDQHLAMFNWTPYAFWPEGIANYALEVKERNFFREVKQLDGAEQQTMYDAFVNSDEEQRCFRIIANSLNEHKDQSSSNTVCLSQKTVLFIPNAFSPDGDGLNDIWKPLSFGVDWAYIRIYNRWGGLVHEQTGRDIQWNGKNALAGTYTFILEIRTPKGELIEKTGSIALIR